MGRRIAKCDLRSRGQGGTCNVELRRAHFEYGVGAAQGSQLSRFKRGELVRAEVGLALVHQNPCGLDGRAVVRHGPPHSLIKRISAELTAPFCALKIWARASKQPFLVAITKSLFILAESKGWGAKARRVSCLATQLLRGGFEMQLLTFFSSLCSPSSLAHLLRAVGARNAAES